MAKAKAKAKAARPKAAPPRRIVLQLKATEDWRGWLGRLGDHLRMPTSTIVDHALIRYAREMGFEEEPPKR